MADEKRTLVEFQNAVFQEINAKKLQIIKDAEISTAQAVEQSTDIAYANAFNVIQCRGQEIKNGYKRQVAKYRLDKKREILVARNEIVARVFDVTIKKLINYTKSGEYKAYFINTFKKFEQSNSFTCTIDILVKPEDMVFEQDIIKFAKFPCKVKASEKVGIGGFIAISEECGLYFDETLEQKLEDQKPNFMQNSSFAI